ncbi:hypothetical protein [Methanoplanus limicola]|uniref:Uncharacterized protein n=1 Tax=Methanoplanus limicola DSM 2279 TaxID=937775 RepID=H1Z380_9EURY|nr:hypothetical protein [Methanoplanus limicola]EHQ36495.1 hypothetical protein Metlim_2447 [Methanoplanus limicola DSM 2279]
MDIAEDNPETVISAAREGKCVFRDDKEEKESGKKATGCGGGCR